jgi:bifunctional DNA-binding transcriptional regulator/antitoxin component of YhaV-PrlF toxin-antitoxin module
MTMTVVYMSEKGELVLPKTFRDAHGLRPGAAFAIVPSMDGDLILRPVKSRPTLTLVDHLRKFKGLEVPEIRAQVRARE